MAYNEYVNTIVQVGKIVLYGMFIYTLAVAFFT